MSAANTGEPLLGLERNRPLHFAGRVRELRVLADYLACWSEPVCNMRGKRSAARTRWPAASWTIPRFSVARREGVLTTAPDGYVSFGIPSFHDYMMEQHRRVVEREARRAQARGRPAG